MHPLFALLAAAAAGRFPPPDGEVTIVPPWGSMEAIVAFTGHAVVATALAPEFLREGRPDGFGGATHPDFQRHIAGPGGTIGALDVVLAANGTGQGSGLVERRDLSDHPRVRHATHLRSAVTVLGDPRGLVTLGTGLGGRRELSIEVTDPGRGHGRTLLRDALGEVAAGEPVFAAVSPGNGRSLRMFLAVGFTPLGSEVIIHPNRR